MRAARVVVVCSQAWVGRLVAGALEARALQVAVYTSTAEALLALRPPVDVLVCDAALEGGPADLIDGLRAFALPGPVPVLCLVPDEPSGGRLLALQAGVDACISQPFRVDELVAQVEALLAFVVRTHSSVPPGRPTLSPLAGPRPTPRPAATRPPPSISARPTPAIGLRPTLPTGSRSLPPTGSSPRSSSRPGQALSPPSGGRASRAPSPPRVGPGAMPASAQRVGPSAVPPAAQGGGPSAMPASAQGVGPSAMPASAQGVGPNAVPPAVRPTGLASSSPAAPRGEVNPPPASALEGDLAHVSLSTVLSLLEMERRSGVISVDDGGRQTGTIDLCLGSPVGGSLGGGRVAPLAVLRRVLAWPQGRFRFQPGPVGDLRTGTRSLGALLMEAMRLADESAAMAASDEASGDGGAPAEGSVPSTQPRSLAAFEERPGSARPPPRTTDSSPPSSARSGGATKSSFPPPVLV